MLRNTCAHFRLRHFIGKIYFNRSLSALPDQYVALDDNSSESHVPYTFDTHFHMKNVLPQDLHLTPEGCYVDVNEEDVKDKLPEDFAGDINNEFEFSGKKVWMMRDVGKLLLRIVDEYSSMSRTDVSTTSSSSNAVNAPRKSTASFKLPIHVDGLTTRPEWNTAQSSIQYYGLNLNSPHLTNKFGPGVNDALKLLPENASNVDKQLAALKALGMPKKFLLQGPRGVGKSVTLNQVVLHARSQGWLVLFVPSAYEHVHGGMFIEPCNSVTESGEELFDNVFVTTNLLRKFWKAHKKELSKLPITNMDALEKYRPYLATFREKWDRARKLGGRLSHSFIQTRAVVEEDDNFPEEDEADAEILAGFDFESLALVTLEDLIILAVAFRDIAGLVFLDLVEELKNVESIPVLIAIDQYNTWIGESGYQYEDKKVMASQLCVPRALSAFSKHKAQTDQWNLKNGLVMCAVSYKHPEGRKDNLLNRVHSVPVTIHVPAYSQIEFLSAVKFYTSQNIVEDIFSTQDLLSFRTHCASLPGIVQSECIPFLLPVAMDKYPGDFLLHPRIQKEVDNLEGVKVESDSDGDLMDSGDEDDDDD